METETKKVLFINNSPTHHDEYPQFGYENGEIARRTMNGRMRHLAERIFEGHEIAFTILYPEDISTEDLEAELKKRQDLIISGGSPHNICEGHVWLDNKLGILKKNYEEGEQDPLLAVCFGHQAIQHAFGGKIEKVDGEYVSGNCGMKIKDQKILTMNASHGFHVTQMGEGFKKIGESTDERKMIYATKHTKYPILTLQQHPEKPLQNGEWCDDEVIEFLRRELEIIKD